MFGSGLLLALRRAVHPCQSFSRCRVAHDIWRSGQCRAFGRRPEPEDDDVKKPPRPKTVPVPRITLVSPDNSTTVTVLEEAQRLAKRRNLTLIKVSDLEAKSQRPIYKLVSSTGILEEFDEDTKDAETDRRDKIVQKDTKLFYISAKITEHDLQTKTKNVLRQLTKRHKVKIVITLDGADGDKMLRVIESAVKNDGSVQRMPSKKNIILLLISPLLKNKDVPVADKNETRSSSN